MFLDEAVYYCYLRPCHSLLDCWLLLSQTYYWVVKMLWGLFQTWLLDWNKIMELQLLELDSEPLGRKNWKEQYIRSGNMILCDYFICNSILFRTYLRNAVIGNIPRGFLLFLVIVYLLLIGVVRIVLYEWHIME